MPKSGFRDNYMLYSGFHNKFRLNSDFCHKFKLNLGFRDNCTLQEEQPDSITAKWTLFLGSLLPTSHLDWSDKPNVSITPKLVSAVKSW